MKGKTLASVTALLSLLAIEDDADARNKTKSATVSTTQSIDNGDVTPQQITLVGDHFGHTGK